MRTSVQRNCEVSNSWCKMSSTQCTLMEKNTVKNFGHSPLKAGTSSNFIDVVEDLLLAVMSDDFDRVRQLIDAGAVIDVKDSLGNTSLHHAVLKKNTEMVRVLLYAGALPNSVNHKWNTPLLLALKFAGASVAHQEKADIENSIFRIPCDAEVSHPIDTCRLNMKCGAADPVQELKIAGANVDALDLDGETTLNCSRDLDIVKLLLDAKADPNVINGAGDTPLQLAIRSGEIDLVNQLIEAGANVNYFNNRAFHRADSPRTPLHDAVNECNVDILKLLLERGADPNEYSVLPAAGHAPRNKIPMLSILLDHGADMFGEYVFRELLQDNDVEGVKLFLERGFDTGRYSQCPELLSQVVRIWDKSTPDCVTNSPKLEDTRMLSLFLDHFRAKGALSFEMEHGDWRGWSALHDAAKEGKSEHTRLLLLAGADPNVAAKDEITPLEWALMHDYCFNNECIQILIEAGATIGDSIERLLNRIFEAQRFLPSREHSNHAVNFKIDDVDREIARYLPIEDWKPLGKSHFRWALRSMRKVFCIVKYRALLESKGSVEDPIIEKIEKSPSLQTYHKACITEIAFLKKCQFDNSLTYYDLLAKKNFYKFVRSLKAFEEFRNEYIGKISGSVSIYMDDLESLSEAACNKYKLWSSATKRLERLIGLNRYAYHLIFSNILDHLSDEDLRSLGMICEVSKP